MTEVDDLRQILDQVASKRWSGSQVQAAGSSEDDLWDELESLGLTLVGASDALGGAGGNLTHAVEVAQAVGRHALPLPIAETALVASWLLDVAGVRIPRGRLTPAGFLETDDVSATVRDGALYLAGTARRVPWATRAKHVVVVAARDDHHIVALVDADRLRIISGANLAGEPRDAVEFATVHASSWARLPEHITLGGIRARAALSRSAQILGALEQTRDLTLEFVQQREQFGRPIIRFQAVAQAVASLAAEVALARAGVAKCLENPELDGPAWEFACGTAKVTASHAARVVAASAHQLHGAIGITAEYPLHQLTRRLLSWQDDDGTETEWSARLGQILPLLGGDAWSALTYGEALI